MNFIERLIKYGIYVALFLPLIFTSGTLYPWHFGKTVLFQVLVEILVVVGAGGFLYERYYLKRGVSRIGYFFRRMRFFDWLILIFLVMQFVSAFLGVDFLKSFWGNLQRMQGVFTWFHFVVFYFLLRIYVIAREDWVKLIGVVLGVAGVSGVIALFGSNLSIFNNIVLEQSRVSGLLGNPIFLAGYLIIPFFLALAMFVHEKRYKQWYLTLMMVILLTIVFTQTRGAYIGVLLGLFTTTLLYLRYGFSSFKKQVVLNFALVVFIVLSFLYFFNARFDFIDENYPRISHVLSINTGGFTARTRMLAWQVGVEGWGERPFFGWGAENYRDLFDGYYNPDFLDYGFSETVWDKPHNNIVEVLVEGGVVGLVLYVGMLFVAVYYLIHAMRRSSSEDARFVCFVLIGAIVGIVGHNFFAFFTSDSLLMWSFLMALSVFLRNDFEDGGSEDVVMCGGRSGGVVFSSVVVFLVVGVMVLSVFYNIRIYKASLVMGVANNDVVNGVVNSWAELVRVSLYSNDYYAWERAIIVIQYLFYIDELGGLELEELRKVSPAIIRSLETAMASNPGSFQYRFWLSKIHSLLGEYVDEQSFVKSNDLLLSSLKISPDRQVVLMSLGKNYLLMGENSRALEVLGELIELDDSQPESYWLLGLAYVYDGQLEAGVVALEKGFVYGKSRDENVLYMVDLYLSVGWLEKIVPLYVYLIERYPDSAEYFMRLASTYAELGDKDEALKNILRAIELDSTLNDGAVEYFGQYGIEI